MLTWRSAQMTLPHKSGIIFGRRHGKGSSYSERGGRRLFRRTCIRCTKSTRMWARSDISNISNCITATISLQISPKVNARNKFNRVEEQRDIRTWQDVTVAELKTYHGLLFLMEVMKFDKLEMYWATSSAHWLVGSVLGDPFTQIKKC